jgi:hypothetical protein
LWCPIKGYGKLKREECGELREGGYRALGGRLGALGKEAKPVHVLPR